MGADSTPQLVVGQKAVITIEIPGGIDTKKFDEDLKALLDKQQFKGRRLVTIITAAPPPRP